MTNEAYYVDMETPLEQIPEHFCNWIESEICTGGLLEEIEKFCSTFRTGGSVLTYEIWVRKMDWTTDMESSSIVSTETYLTLEYPFEVAIIVDTLDDEEESEKKAIQLQAKTIMSVFKNFERMIFDDPSIGYVNYMTLETGFNDGSINPVNREDDVIIKGFRITLNVDINWLMCYHRYKNKQEEEEIEDG